MLRRRMLAVIVLTLASTVLPACDPAPVVEPGDISTPSDEEPAEGSVEARGATEELEEQQERTEQRLEALEEAKAEGLFGAGEPALGEPAPGWAGEQVMSAGTDDWEPATAADPNAPFVYLLTTRYAAKPCAGNCPTPYLVLEVSGDGGRTWNDGVPLCACKGSGQYDPIIEVVPDTGDVYAVYMNGYNVVFTRSIDHGLSWSEPVPTWGKVSWGDKPALATDATGQHVYLSWNGPQGGDPWIAQSHDFGQTWSQMRVARTKRYYFAYDGVVMDDGTAVLSESSITYTAPGATPEGVVEIHAFVSHDLGATWRNVVVDSVQVGQPCADCRADYYIGHTSVTVDGDGRLVYAYDGATEALGPQRAYVRSSTDGGLTWSPRIAVSSASEHASSPMVEATGDGDVRLVYMQTSGGGDVDRWNAWFRRSTDGGRTWSAPLRISDASSGAEYKHPEGFEEIYGDYGEIVITSTGKTFAVWGEAFSYIGPGGTWFNREL